jgi:hypothetical protein
LKEELARAAGSNFAGLILYGGLARGRYRSGRSDVNVLVFLHDASAPALASLAPALQAAWRTAAVEPMLLTPEELPGIARTFPTKFLDIKNHHVVLGGADPLTTLDVPRAHLQLRNEQEFRNLLLRLRRGYVRAGNDARILARILVRTARPFALELAALLHLAGKSVPEEDRTAAIFEAAASAFGLDREPLARLAALRADLRPSGDLAGLVQGILQALARAAEISAQLKEPPR